MHTSLTKLLCGALLTLLVVPAAFVQPATAEAAPTPISSIVTTDDFITHVYSCVLETTPNTIERTDLRDDLTSNIVDATDVYDDLFSTRESVDPITNNGDFVDNLYHCILFRNADSGGHSYWTGELSSGNKTRSYVINHFLTSTEFTTTIEPDLATAIANNTHVTLQVVASPSTSTEFSTLQAAIDEVANLNPNTVDGVTILINKDVLNLTTTIVIDETVDIPLTIFGNGSNGKTTLTTSTAVPASQLTSLGGNIYSYTAGANDVIYGLVIGGVMKPPAEIEIDAPRYEGTSDTVYVADTSIDSTSFPTYITGDIQWRYFSCPVDSISATGTSETAITVTSDCADLDDQFEHPTWGGVFQFNTANALVNHPDGMTTHGDWVANGNELQVYLNSAQAITVLKKPLDSYIEIAGASGDRVENITLENLGFINGGTPVVKDYATRQSGFYKTLGNGNDDSEHDGGALLIEHANNITLHNLVFKNLTSYGIRVKGGAFNVAITHSDFSHLGQGAVAIGEAAQPEDHYTGSFAETNPGVFSDITVTDNVVYNTGVLNHNVSAIFASYVQDSTFSDNNINTTPYSGISVGWGWNYTTATDGLGDNAIERNVITNPMHTLFDGGGIYTLSRQAGTVIRDNIVQYISNGHIRVPIHLDGGSSDMTVEDNTFKNLIEGYFDNINNVSEAQPILGPDTPISTSTSPCGKKACNITLSNNVVE